MEMRVIQLFSDLDVLESQAQRCRRIIDSWLEFSRCCKGVTSKTDLNDLIQETLSLVGNDLTLKGIKLETNYAGNGTTACMDWTCCHPRSAVN